ncbi:death-associated inhibitor of apoptosis 2-like [Neocloeon triangulifer]|uniref:death-associated inhibitor of apoptosis 2-like n=1 Tax=Neocloeon triangulifer TaxID=2078957 RepID=UPI00286F3422|nr:death-associated inhibitor of apoptosis 2-like [Neocloeon triangulifer]XP_059485371.1 death-associated inhibitor of apoptosis 2-like [Neocloeon triangulifer]
MTIKPEVKMSVSSDKYFLEIHRYLSFPADFGEKKKVSVSALASSGFYYNDGGHPKCHFCDYVICSNMEEWSTNVELMHMKSSPDCPMLDGDGCPENICICHIPNYNYECYRLYSFPSQNWPKASVVSPAELASNGFYFTGRGDNVRCAFCYLEVCQWEEGDTALGEHKKFNPLCPFLKGCAYNIEIGEERSEPRKPTPVDIEKRLAKYGALKVMRNAATKNIEVKINARALGVVITNSPKHPEMNSSEKRIKSFELWPEQKKLMIEKLAEAGFFYTGSDDHCTCFCCGYGLRNWDLEHCPMTEHCKLFPKCVFLQLNRDETYNEEADDLIDLKKCKGCLEMEIDTACLPCGHMAYCEQCVQQHEKCPTCSQYLLFFLKIYVP